MKKLLVLLVACLLLTGCAREGEASRYWWGMQDDISVGVHLFPDRDGLWPLDTQTFTWERNDYSDGLDATRLHGGEYRCGTWSVKADVLTLQFDDGEVMKGTFSEEGLLLSYAGGFLLEYCHPAIPDKVDSSAAP